MLHYFCGTRVYRDNAKTILQAHHSETDESPASTINTFVLSVSSSCHYNSTNECFDMLTRQQ